MTTRKMYYAADQRKARRNRRAKVRNFLTVAVFIIVYAVVSNMAFVDYMN